MKNEYYPLGTVVRLKNGSKKIMICGRLQQRVSDQKVFDYCACYYPEGILNTEELFVFQADEIKEVIFTGYQDEEEQEFQEYLQYLAQQHQQ